MSKSEFDIQFLGLKAGKHILEYNIDKSFFDEEENLDFEDIRVKVKVNLNILQNRMDVELDIKGDFTLLCDYSNEKFDSKFKDKFEYIAHFGEREDFEDDEAIVIIKNKGIYNIYKPIRDTILLNLPRKRVLPDIESGKIENKNWNNSKKYIKETLSAFSIADIIIKK